MDPTVRINSNAADAWITSRVKGALLTTTGTGGTGVNVETVNRQVTLRGTVRTAEEKEQVRMVVQAVSGVRGIRNLLQVPPPQGEGLVRQSRRYPDANPTCAR